MIGQVTGLENNFKNFISVLYNSYTEKYDVCFNAYFKSPLAKVYDIDSDYDFGSLRPVDLVVDMYIKGQIEDAGITKRT